MNGVKLPLMLPMKDKLALGHTDVKDMVAFMRAFKDGKQVVSAVPSGPAPEVPAQLAQALAPAVPAAASTTASATPAATTTQPPTPTQQQRDDWPGRNRPAGNLDGSPASRGPDSSYRIGLRPVVRSTVNPAPPTARTPLPEALPVTAASAANKAARAEKLRVAGATFNTLCIACHGPDGRGTLVRLAMPAHPRLHVAGLARHQEQSASLPPASWKAREP